MSFLLAGNDPRYPALAEMLREGGTDAHILSDPREARDAEALLTRYPLDPEAEEAAKRLPRDARLILLATRSVDERTAGDKRTVSLMDDLVFVNENAILTAEGAIAAAMRDAPFAITGEKALVIGYGRIGRALTEMLSGLRARVTVASRRECGRLAAMARGAQSVSVENMTREIPDSRLIFVTSPDRMLSRRELSYASRASYIYDLSGAPYGLDLEAARELGLNARRESALPGRYAPESAARAMYRAILRIWNGEAKGK